MLGFITCSVIVTSLIINWSEIPPYLCYIRYQFKAALATWWHKSSTDQTIYRYLNVKSSPFNLIWNRIWTSQLIFLMGNSWSNSIFVDGAEGEKKKQNTETQNKTTCPAFFSTAESSGALQSCADHRNPPTHTRARTHTPPRSRIQHRSAPPGGQLLQGHITVATAAGQLHWAESRAGDCISVHFWLFLNTK